MFETDKNMIKVIDHLKDSGLIKYKTEAYEVMNLDTVRVYKIRFPEKFSRKQANHFSAEDIRLLCKHFNINANYIYGLEANMFLK